MENMTVEKHSFIIALFMESGMKWGKEVFGDEVCPDYGHVEIFEF